MYYYFNALFILSFLVYSGDPFPTIQWDKDNVLNGFDADRFEVLPNGSLKLMSTLFEGLLFIRSS